MRFFDVREAARFAPHKMQKVPLEAGERLMVDLYCLEPGQAQKVHAHEGHDKLYLVLEGEAVIHIAGEEATVREGQGALAPAGAEHGIRNEGPARLRCLVAAAPPLSPA